MSNVRKHGLTQERSMPSVKVKLAIRAGLNTEGKQSRSYVQQITGPNTARVATVSRTGKSAVYDWVVSNPVKVGKSATDAAGRFHNVYELGDGIYRVVQPKADYVGYPETIFVAISGGKTTRIEQNAARAAFGLPALEIGKAKAETVSLDGAVSL